MEEPGEVRGASRPGEVGNSKRQIALLDEDDNGRRDWWTSGHRHCHIRIESGDDLSTFHSGELGGWKVEGKSTCLQSSFLNVIIITTALSRISPLSHNTTYLRNVGTKPQEFIGTYVLCVPKAVGARLDKGPWKAESSK